MQQTLDISWEAIGKILITGFVLYILFLTRDFVIWFFFGLIISILLDPAIRFLRKVYMPKVIAVVLVYLAIFGLLGLLIYLLAPIFIFEISQLINNLPEYFEKINPLLKSFGFDVTKNFKGFTADLIIALQESSASIIKAISVLFGGIVSTTLIFVFAFYISLEEKGPEKFLSLLVPKKYEQSVISIFEKAQVKVSRWFGTRILASLFVGVFSFFIFLLFGTKYIFILSLISGILTFVPFIGPLITSVLVLLFIGASDSWLIAVYIVVALAIVQQIENSFFTPLIMKKFLDLPPILVLMAILIGGKMFGLLGAIFVVPVFGIIYEFSKEFLERRKALNLSDNNSYSV